jgi:small subunit ribosomal protein S17
MNEQVKAKRVLTGRVISNKMEKTIIVLIERKIPHPKYGKYVTRRTKLYAHDENNTCQMGDWVVIQEGRPLSKNKNWTLVNIVEKA